MNAFRHILTAAAGVLLWLLCFGCASAPQPKPVASAPPMPPALAQITN